MVFVIGAGNLISRVVDRHGPRFHGSISDGVGATILEAKDSAGQNWPQQCKPMPMRKAFYFIFRRVKISKATRR